MIKSPVTIGIKHTFNFRPWFVSATNQRVTGFVRFLALPSIKKPPSRLAKHSLISHSVTGGIFAASFSRMLRVRTIFIYDNRKLCIYCIYNLGLRCEKCTFFERIVLGTSIRVFDP